MAFNAFPGKGNAANRPPVTGEDFLTGGAGFGDFEDGLHPVAPGGVQHAPTAGLQQQWPEAPQQQQWAANVARGGTGKGKGKFPTLPPPGGAPTDEPGQAWTGGCVFQQVALQVQPDPDTLLSIPTALAVSILGEHL